MRRSADFPGRRFFNGGNKMSKIVFTGIMPALLTPFDRDGRIMHGAVKQLVDWHLSCGVQGFYVCGGTGEGVVLSKQQRMEMLECAIDAVAGRGKVIAHTGAINPNDAFELTKHATKAGADGVSSVPPDFYYSYTPREMIDFYTRLAGCTDLPLIAYATNKTGGLDICGIASALIKVENIVGVKDTRSNYFEMWKLKQINGGDINVINGPDESLICGLTMGADGGIGTTYNIMPEKFVEIYRRFRAGDLKGALAMQTEVNRIISVLIKHAHGSALRTVKCSLAMSGIDVGLPAYPAGDLTADEKAAFKAAMIEAGYRY